MEQIATGLNLSRSTVSFALGPHWQERGIPKQTRERVQAKSKELGYRRNRIAMSLRSRVTFTIGLVQPAKGDFYNQLLFGIESVLGQEYQVLFSASLEEPAKEKAILESFAERMVDGLIIVGANGGENLPLLRQSMAQNVPVVQLSRHWSELPSDAAVLDNIAIGSMLTQHLLQQGYWQIHFVRSQDVNSTTVQRVQGYEDVMRENGLTPRVLPVGAKPWQVPFAWAHDCVRGLLQEAKPPLAVITHDFPAVLGALQATREAGLRCPGDVALCCAHPSSLDPIYQFICPRITVAEYSLYELGQCAARLLLARLANRKGQPRDSQTMMIPSQLAIAESTASSRDTGGATS